MSEQQLIAAASPGAAWWENDPIGDAAAMMLEEIEEHSGEELYRNPFLARRIQRVRAELEQLQAHIEGAAALGS